MIVTLERISYITINNIILILYLHFNFRLPLACDIIFRNKKYFLFIKWCLISLGTILVSVNYKYFNIFIFINLSFINLIALQVYQVATDSYFYGKLVIAPFNIVFYNLFTSHGPDLYGTEPWTFYILNGILNFNVVFILSLMAPIAIALRMVCTFIFKVK